MNTLYFKIFIFKFPRFPSTCIYTQKITSCGGELFNVKRSDNFIVNQRGPVRLAAPPDFMFKTSLQLDISSLGLLPCWACQTGQPDSLTPESAAVGCARRRRRLQPAVIVPSHMRSHLTLLGNSCVVLETCSGLSTRLSASCWFFSRLPSFVPSRPSSSPLPSSLLSSPPPPTGVVIPPLHGVV